MTVGRATRNLGPRLAEAPPFMMDDGLVVIYEVKWPFEGEEISGLHGDSTGSGRMRIEVSISVISAGMALEPNLSALLGTSNSCWRNIDRKGVETQT
jgi:hypothetical protein